MLIKSICLLALFTTNNLHTATNRRLSFPPAREAISASDLLASIFDDEDSEDPSKETKINPDWADPNFNWGSMFSPGHYPCLEGAECNAAFNSMQELRNHLKSSHPNLSLPFFCPCLDKAIQAKSPDFKASLPLTHATLVAWHYRAHQRDPEDSTSREATQEVSLRRSQRKRRRPQNESDTDTFFYDDSDTKRDKSRNKQGPKKRKAVTCCGITYSSESSLRFHRQSKHSDINFSCPYCGNSLVAASSLLLHLRTFHSEKRSSDRLPCRVQNCKINIHWEPMLAIHEAKCRAKLQAKLLKHEREESAGDPDDL